MSNNDSKRIERSIWNLTPFLLAGFAGMIVGVIAMVIYDSILAIIPVFVGAGATVYNTHILRQIIDKGRKFP